MGCPHITYIIRRLPDMSCPQQPNMWDVVAQRLECRTVNQDYQGLSISVADFETW